MTLEQDEITKINNYLFAIRILAEKSNNEYTDSIIQLITDIEKITFQWEE